MSENLPRQVATTDTPEKSECVNCGTPLPWVEGDVPGSFRQAKCEKCFPTAQVASQVATPPTPEPVPDGITATATVTP